MRSLFARARWNSASSTAPRQPLAQPPITFQVPFTAHGFASRRVLLRVPQTPNPPTRRQRACPGIVLGKTPVQIGCPADIGSIAVFAPTTENVNEAFHGYFAGAVAVIVGATEGRNFVNPAGFSRHRNSRLTTAIVPN